MEKNFNFTTAFAMRCDAEQFKSVRSELDAMRYEIYEISSDWEGFCYVVNNYDNTFGRITNIVDHRKNKNNRLVIETFNRELCLALAAMTDKPDGIVGEWFKGSNGTFIQKKDDCDIASIATKATADELIKYFTEAKLEHKQPETDPQIELIKKQIEDLETVTRMLIEKVTGIKPPEPQPASRFADKQPIWAWDNDWKAKRNEVFWDAKNKCAYWADGDRSGYSYDNYEPIPADQIPAWMVEAAKHLED